MYLGTAYINDLRIAFEKKDAANAAQVDTAVSKMKTFANTAFVGIRTLAGFKPAPAETDFIPQDTNSPKPRL